MISNRYFSLISSMKKASTPASTLNTGLVSVYNADNNANDSFGSNNGTEMGGLTYVTGKIGQAFQFNGTTSYISIPNTTNHLNFTGDFSISFWVNYNTTAASLEVFLSNMQSGGSHGSGWVIYTDTSTLRFALNAQNSINDYNIPFTPSTNTWYNVVVTRKRSIESKIYINGVEVIGSYFGTQTLNETYQIAQEYNIGAYILPQRYLSNIKMDVVNFWNKVLTATEITELYNSGNAKQYPF